MRRIRRSKQSYKAVNQNTVNNIEGEDALKGNSQINFDLANELMGLLNEINMPSFDVSEGGQKYLNLETKVIPYSDLRRAAATEPARLIINKRCFDLLQWGQIRNPNRGGIERGVGLEFKNPDYNPTREERAELRKWETIIFEKLFFPPYEKHPNFGKFLTANYADFFALDDLTWEYRKDGYGNIVGVQSVDPIIYKPIIKERRINSFMKNYYSDYTEILENYEKLYDLTPEEIEAPDYDYAIVFNNKTIGYATTEEARKSHFFVSSNHKWAQRGNSITEQGLNMLAWILNALKMNSSNFTNNRMPLGFVHFSGNVGQLALEKLKKSLYAYQNGTTNSQRFPMISTPEKNGAQFVNMRPHSRDLEYHQFMTLLFSIYCQLSGTDPREVALSSYADAVGRKSLFEESSDGLVRESRDAGQRTFLLHGQDSLNAPFADGLNLFEKITKMPCRLKFYGFEVEDKQKRLELNKQKLGTTSSLNELLAAEDKEKQELVIGGQNFFDIPGIANQQIFQAVMLRAQEESQRAVSENLVSKNPEDGNQTAVSEKFEIENEERGLEENELQNSKSEAEEELTERDRELLNKYKDIAQLVEE